MILNGQSYEYSGNIKALVERLGLDMDKVAIEVNLEIIPRSKYSAYILNQNDNVEIVHFIGGG
jgi:sulfur carrier protein